MSSCYFAGDTHTGPCLRGSGGIVRETRDVGAFSGISAGFAGDIIIRQDSVPNLVVEARENIIGELKTEVTDDILEVYFIVYRPDGTTNGNKIQLFDDGDSENGDVTAGDGIYSRLIQVDQSNQKGTYRFDFQAEDRLGALSNIVNHIVLIQ